MQSYRYFLRNVTTDRVFDDLFSEMEDNVYWFFNKNRLDVEFLYALWSILVISLEDEHDLR